MQAPLTSDTPATSAPAVMRIGLIAGEGLLPVHVAKNAVGEGLEVIPFSIHRANREALKLVTGHKPQAIVPGLLGRTYEMLVQAQITHLVFAGKVNKWLLLCDPRLDEHALQALREYRRLADDDIMHWLVARLEERNIEVLSQTRFLQNLFLPARQLSAEAPTEREQADIAYGREMAKEMGRLDIGQTVVVKDGMIIAVEAIEGTDECLKRAGKLARKKGGVVVKVAKPGQDQRFDVPTVGLRTLKVMRQAGLRVLATEASQTLYLDPEAMADYANRHRMVIVSV